MKEGYKKIKATHRIEYVEVKTKSRAGVEYTSNKPVKVAVK